MKPSHLACLMLAACPGGLIGGPATTSEIPHLVIKAERPFQSTKEISLNYLMPGTVGIEHHPMSWRKLNQRQLRKNARRAHAAGVRHDFA